MRLQEAVQTFVRRARPWRVSRQRIRYRNRSQNNGEDHAKARRPKQYGLQTSGDRERLRHNARTFARTLARMERHERNRITRRRTRARRSVGSAYKESPAGIKATIDAAEEFARVPLDPMWLPTKEEVEAKLKKRNRFAGMSLGQLENLPPLQWSIDGLVPKGQLIELYGPPKAGKTFVAIDMGLCIATGRDYHGRRRLKAPCCISSAKAIRPRYVTA